MLFQIAELVVSFFDVSGCRVSQFSQGFESAVRLVVRIIMDVLDVGVMW
jgi:hypothetical protein